MIFDQSSYAMSGIKFREERLDRAAISFEIIHQLRLEEESKFEETQANKELEHTSYEVMYDESKPRMR